MNNFEISSYLINYDMNKNTGTCKSCKKNVQWAKDRLAAHKRSSCSSAIEEEKRFFSKQRSESSIQSNQQISNSVETSAITEESQNKIDIKLANFFFRTGISLRIVELEDFKELVKETESFL
ncbi:hypothetical protein PVAND_013402 [Polypedilum vanderplanki]|uniref:Uncharacterized protein n=1 Tax=Polypedilum vanderplanki TaxID=319348 RepID=A0A9J6CPL1_POLVA|nr:hypothetical protein PVAND_013402 [Polypedilum vanderplanki]